MNHNEPPRHLDTRRHTMQQTYSMTDEEYKSAQRWDEEHRKSGCPLVENSGAIGGRLTIAFTPTSLGPAVVVSCGCGASENVTDYDCW